MPAVVLCLALLATLLACAKPNYLPRDEIIEVSINFLDQARDALEEGALHRGRYLERRDRALQLQDGNYTSEAEQQAALAAEEKARAIANYAYALEQLRLSERVNVRPLTCFLYGQLFNDLGNYERALEYLDLGLSLSPDYEQARRFRTMIASRLESIQQGIAPPPENWTAPVEELASLGPVSPDELAPAVREDLTRPTVLPVARANTPTPEPLDDGGRPRKEVPETETGPAEPVETIPVTERRATPTPRPTQIPTPVPTEAEAEVEAEIEVTGVDRPEEEGLVEEPPVTPVPVEEDTIPEGVEPEYREALELLAQARAADANQNHERAARLYEQAADLLREARQDDPVLRTNPVASYNLGNAYLGMGQLDAAIAEYQRAIDLDPDYGKAWNNMGLAYARGGHTNSALEAFEKAVDTAGILDAHYNAGMLYIKRNDVDRAIEHLEDYVAEDPGSVFGQQAGRQLILLRRRM